MAAKDAAAEDVRLKTVTIEVNDHKVEMPAGPATGLEIKEAAIKGSPETGVGGLRPVGSADKGGAAEERRLGTEVDSRL